MKTRTKSRSQIETKRPHKQKGGKARSSRPSGRRESGETAIAPSVSGEALAMPEKIVDASKKEALDLSSQAQEGAKAIEKAWWKLARLVDICLKRHVPRALGLNAKQWMEKYLEGSVSDAFRKRRRLEKLAGIPDEKIEAMKQANADQLCRLPEAERKSEEWVDLAATVPIGEFKEKVEKRLDERHIPREKFGEFVLKGPLSVIAEMEAAEKKVAAMLSLDTLSGSWRVQAWEAIAALVNITPEERLKEEMVGQ